VLVCVALSFSMAVAILPLRANVARPVKASCCAETQAQSSQKHCPKHMPKGQSDQQCCAACIVGMAVFIGGTAPLLLPPHADQTFAGYNFDEHLRSERPPVPPPRLAVA
jgi:hypothetical protein